MSFHGAVRLLLVAWTGRWPAETSPGRSQPLPEIPTGRFAAWARDWPGRSAAAVTPGSACRTPDGREGLVVEVIEQGRTILVCTPA